VQGQAIVFRSNEAFLHSALTNALSASLYGLPVGPVPPLDDARSTPQNRALVTSDIRSRSRTSGSFRLRLGARPMRFSFVRWKSGKWSEGGEQPIEQRPTKMEGRECTLPVGLRRESLTVFHTFGQYFGPIRGRSSGRR